LEPEAKKLNEAYFKYITTKLPFVVLKVIGSLNGRIVQPFKSSKLRQKMFPSAYEHLLPAGIDAILFDASIANDYNLVQVDSKKPRLILTGTWKEILSKFKKIKHKDIILVPFDQKMKDERIEGQSRIWKMKKRKNGKLDFLWLLKKMGEEGITSVLVEAENKISTSLIQQELVDKIWYQIFPEFYRRGEESFGDLGIKKISDAIVLKNCEFKQFQNSLLVVGYPA
jgi:diaminohydroxyphosphoribosylaminopyrimidine deaminase / 5-amino-6-(5-phosphoribosylamino)uracil reductase